VWFSPKDPRFQQFIAVKCTELSFLLYWMNDDAPRFEARTAAQMSLDDLIVVLSSDGDAFVAACQAALAERGVYTTVHAVERVGDADGYSITFLEVVARRYEAEQSRSQYSAESIVADEDASGGAVRLGVKAESPRYVTYGPYISLNPGDYQLHYRIRVSDAGSARLVARCDVVGQVKRHSTTLRSIDLSGRDFQTAKDFQDIILECSCPETTHDAEFRVENLGDCDVAVDFVSIERRNQKSARANSTQIPRHVASTADLKQPKTAE
jgi:hypothetical protein